MEMDDQVTVVSLKIIILDQEGLLIQLTYVYYETQDTIQMKTKIPEKADEEMA